MGGRGSGKTAADAHYVDAHAMGPACLAGRTPHRIGIIAGTHDDAKRICVVGETGLLVANPAIEFRPGGKEADLMWPTGAVATLFGAYAPEDIERLRGPQHCLIWAEELAVWRYLGEVWDMARLGLRLGPRPRFVAGTTPKPRKHLIKLVGQPGTVVTRARTRDNPYLHPDVHRELQARYAGTRIGRQELEGELLLDLPGALWQRDMIQYGQPPQTMLTGELTDDYQRVVVAIDPAVTYGPDSDETGITVCAKGADGNGYVVDDLSGRFSVQTWAKRAIAAHDRYRADAIVGEVNNGGDLVEANLRAMGFTGRYQPVNASRGKRIRAEPIAALYEQGRIFHLRPFPELEDQLCNFEQADVESPDRLDSTVWGMTQLFLTGPPDLGDEPMSYLA